MQTVLKKCAMSQAGCRLTLRVRDVTVCDVTGRLPAHTARVCKGLHVDGWSGLLWVWEWRLCIAAGPACHLAQCAYHEGCARSLGTSHVPCTA
jgi:hypothetical protein